MGPPKCGVCGGGMKPLFQSFYCPKDCDRIPERVEPETTQPIIRDWPSGGVIRWSGFNLPVVDPAAPIDGVFYINPDDEDDGTFLRNRRALQEWLRENP